MEYAVAVQEIEKKFGDFVAVNRISFDVMKGQIFGFLGPNGSGKSTTIRMLCGILIPTAGKGFVDGLEIGREAEKIKAKIGYMSQRFSLYEDLTVEENIDFYSGIYTIPPQLKEERKAWVLAMAGLQEYRHERTSILSGGWKQRLALGCAILHQPPILFLDEPTSGVDPVSRRHFWNLIYQLSNAGITVFVTTHYMDEAEYFDQIAFIYEGNLIAKGSPEQIKKEIVRETIFELHCECAYDLMDALEQQSIVKEVALFGSGLHIMVKEEISGLKTIVNLTKSHNLPIKSLKKINPTLEDAFIALIDSHQQVERA